jgi:hypothetical protein
MLMGTFAFMLYYISPLLITTLGPSLGVIFIGFLFIMGPSDPHISQGLLNILLETDFEKLNEEDYVYVNLSYRSIIRWAFISIFTGGLFVILSPFGAYLPDTIAFSIVVFTQLIIWTPTLAIAQFSIVLAMLYIAFVIPLIVFLVGKTVQFVRRFLSKKK